VACDRGRPGLGWRIVVNRIEFHADELELHRLHELRLLADDEQQFVELVQRRLIDLVQQRFVDLIQQQFIDRVEHQFEHLHLGLTICSAPTEPS
jgi:hypothetical protein